MLKATQHFILSFFGPPVVAIIFGYMFYLIQGWIELETPVMLIGLLVVAVATFVITRWAIHALVPVACPYCRGRCHEIDGRGGCFMCMV